MIEMISVVTITNGDRWQFLRQVLQNLIGNSMVNNIVLVNNAVTYDLHNEVDSLKTEKIHIINLDKNYGSSGAFKKGLEFLSQQESTKFILMLDDDNLPSEGAVELLYKRWNKFSVESKEAKLALLALR